MHGLMRKILLLIGLAIIALVVLVLLIGMHNNGINQYVMRAVCVLSGKEWKFIYDDKGHCSQLVKDEGKVCYQNFDCQVDCVIIDYQELIRDSDGFILGSCGASNIYNCYRTIPQKTKETHELQPGACI